MTPEVYAFLLGIFVGIISTIFVRKAYLQISKSIKTKLKFNRRRQSGPRRRRRPAPKDVRQVGNLKLVVQRDDSMYGYTRDVFGPGLSSIIAGDGGMSPRDKILLRDGKRVKVVGNKIVHGQWHCPYTGAVMSHPSDVEIDHIVPLAEAWRSGAQMWAPNKMWEFNRDETNLVAVSKAANRNKSDKDITAWLPKYNKTQYLADWIRIKNAFGLTMDEQEFVLIDQLTKTDF
jgi:hypothetical protein